MRTAQGTAIIIIWDCIKAKMVILDNTRTSDNRSLHASEHRIYHARTMCWSDALTMINLRHVTDIVYAHHHIISPAPPAKQSGNFSRYFLSILILSHCFSVSSHELMWHTMYVCVRGKMSSFDVADTVWMRIKWLQRCLHKQKQTPQQQQQQKCTTIKCWTSRRHAFHHQYSSQSVLQKFQ